MSDCYYDTAGCLVCPEQDAVAAVPATVERRAVLGWNAGSDSIATVDGDLHVVFDMPLNVIGTIIGLKSDRAKQTIPSLVEHGFYFQKSGSADLFQPIESGAPVGAPVLGRAAEASFEIRRIKRAVTYWKDGVMLYASTKTSVGSKIVNCCLYASGDTAPGTPT